jgi:diguanylate cyclase (GGDEF)-like protein
MEDGLRRLAERLREESIRDGLTKMYNRRHLDERLLGGFMRVEDMLARFGGEEFAVVLRNTDVASAHVVAERLRSRVEASPVRLGDHDIAVTISAGCASLAEMQEYSAGALLALADGRMYAAKAAGKNKVVSSTQRAGPEV